MSVQVQNVLQEVAQNGSAIIHLNSIGDVRISAKMAVPTNGIIPVTIDWKDPRNQERNREVFEDGLAAINSLIIVAK